MLLYNFYRYFVKFSLFRYLTYIYRIIYKMAQFPFFNKHFLLHLSRGFRITNISLLIFLYYTHISNEITIDLIYHSNRPLSY